ncbi:MAG: FAD-dependent oxidoreductase [Pseudomonadota bacterium]
MTNRADHVAALTGSTFDAVIVGGGINGAVSAAALAAHGARVALIDSRDFAGFTSQHSSNLVWGGIKYMENFEFGLVAGLCKSRNELMRAFPSTIREIRFLTTVDKGFRHSPRMLWMGAWLYWLFGRGFTQPPRLRSAAGISADEPLVDVSNSPGGIEYSDAYLADNDARFVWNFIRSAMDSGCVAANYVRCTGAAREAGGRWRLDALDTVSGQPLEIRAHVYVNATGAFADRLNVDAGVTTSHRHLLSKGIHLLVPRLSAERRVLAFFADDGRLFFAIPMASCTCIGTTDTRVDRPDTAVTDEDRDFVLSNINARLNLPRPLTRDDIIAERCGVRPLVVERGDGAGSDFLQLSRKHVVEVDREQAHISIFGGKLTDCLNVGEEICAEARALGVDLVRPAAPWYGEPGEDVRRQFDARARSLQLHGLAAEDTGERVTDRFWRRYGARAEQILDRIETDRRSLDPVIAGTGLRWCEVDYMREHEMIVRLDDAIRRRSKLAMVVGAETLRAAPGIGAMCDHLFGDDAPRRHRDYFESGGARSD